MDARLLRLRYHTVAFRLAEGAGKLVVLCTASINESLFRLPKPQPYTLSLIGKRFDCDIFSVRESFLWNPSQNKRPSCRLGQLGNNISDYPHPPAQTLYNAYEACHVFEPSILFSPGNANANARAGCPCLLICT